MKSTIVRNAALALALAGVTATSYAGVRASAVRPSNWTGPAAATLVPLNAGGATTLSFNLPKAGKKVLTYSAECYVSAGAGNWLDLDITFNGVVVAPTAGSSDAFCSANGLFTRASITVVVQGIQGNNNVTIHARSTAGGTWLGDTSLVIHD